MADTLARTHPLGAWRPSFAAASDELAAAPGTDLAIGLEPMTAALDLRVDPMGIEAVAALVGGSLPTAPNTWTPIAGGRAVWLGPDEWLLTGDGTPGEDAVRAVVGPFDGTAVDVSAQRTAMALRGRDARGLLSFGCALDLRPASLPPGSCAQTLLGQAGVLLLADDDGFLVVVRSSFAGYVADWLLDAAQEFRTDRGAGET